MGLRKRILCEGPDREMTEDEKKQFELAWSILCKTGSVNFADPLDTEENNIKEILQKDPAAFTRAHCDYYDCNETPVPYDEFVKQILENNEE